MNQLKYLSSQVLDDLKLTTPEIIASIEHLIKQRDKQSMWNAPKAVVQPPDGRYMMAAMAAADDPPYMVVKSVILNPQNPARGIAQINASVVLHHSQSGLLLAVIDGNWITAVRTAGLSATAAQYLARPDAKSMGFIGCGVQAHSHLQAFSELFPLQEIHAYGRGNKNRDALCLAAEEHGLRAVAADNAAAVVRAADILVTSVTYTPDLQPFLDANWLKEGAFAAITDLAAPWYAESFQTLDNIVVDDLEQERKMAKPLVEPSWVSGDLTSMVLQHTHARTHPKQRTAFVFRGLALGDLALAALAYKRAEQHTSCITPT